MLNAHSKRIGAYTAQRPSSAAPYHASSPTNASGQRRKYMPHLPVDEVRNREQDDHTDHREAVKQAVSQHRLLFNLQRLAREDR